MFRVSVLVGLCTYRLATAHLLGISMNNRLSVFFERKPRHSKSTSQLDASFSSSSLVTQQQSHQPRMSRSRDTMTIMHEYNFGRPLPPLPPQSSRSSNRSTHAVSRPHAQTRAGTAPVLHPPDELFLKMIRRRSASAVLQESTRWPRDDQEDQEVAERLAFASAVPPVYFDQPPEYTAYDTHAESRIDTPQRSHTKLAVAPHTYNRSRHDELFLTIDETIASFKVTQPTPVDSPQPYDHIVSPMNDIDQLYLERRRRRKHQNRR